MTQASSAVSRAATTTCGRGWRVNRGYREKLREVSALAAAAIAVATVVVSAAGCAKRVRTPGALGEAREQPGVSEEGVGKTSLEELRSGTLGKETPQTPLKDLHFAFDSYELSPEARGILESNAEWLREHPQAKVEIEGHCDERGTVEYNLALGAKRAAAVRDYLVSLGTDAGRLTTISYGEELPLCREATEECWQRNRRAHFVVLSE